MTLLAIAPIVFGASILLGAGTESRYLPLSQASRLSDSARDFSGAANDSAPTLFPSRAGTLDANRTLSE
jgi:hypothetical protein